jgi:hypothetical protein
VSRITDLDDYLDPKSLTSEELYTLQSETWADGVDYERERITKLLLDGWIDESSPILKEIRNNNE